MEPALIFAMVLGAGPALITMYYVLRGYTAAFEDQKLFLAFGIGLILLLLSGRPAGPAVVGPAAFLAACSPMMSYYSRYYIQETLLVFFAMGLIAAAYRFLVTGRTRWAAAAGIFGGLMSATKETWVISIGAMGVALLATLLVRRRERAGPFPVRLRSIGAGVAAGIGISILFYSSFFSHWEGVRDALYLGGREREPPEIHPHDRHPHQRHEHDAR